MVLSAEISDTVPKYPSKVIRVRNIHSACFTLRKRQKGQLTQTFYKFVADRSTVRTVNGMALGVPVQTMMCLSNARPNISLLQDRDLHGCSNGDITAFSRGLSAGARMNTE